MNCLSFSRILKSRILPLALLFFGYPQLAISNVFANIFEHETGPVSCWFSIPEDEKAICGMLSVPENRQKPGSKTIQMAYVVLKSKSTHPQPDPVVYLEGGPGASSLENIETWWKDSSSLRADRDFILFDQRGINRSQPNLDCPEVKEKKLFILGQSLSDAELQRQVADAAMKCQTRLISKGINLTAYNTEESAADLEDLRKKLGYSAWNLYGGSYGTRLALVLMRRYPENIRSAALDSVYPPQVLSYIAELSSMDHALNKLFEDCSQDRECHRAFPDLKQTVLKIVDEWNKHPKSMTFIDPEIDQKSHTIVVDGAGVLGVLVASLSQTELIPILPSAIAALDQGKTKFLAEMKIATIEEDNSINEGLYWSVQCREEFPFNSSNGLLRETNKYPLVTPLVTFDEDWFTCPYWKSGRADAQEKQPVTSSIPTLILSGGYDTNTPPSWAEEAASTLPHSFLISFPAAGHGITLTDCGKSLVVDFIQDPTIKPQSSCVNEFSQPSFITTPFPSDISDSPS